MPDTVTLLVEKHRFQRHASSSQMLVQTPHGNPRALLKCAKKNTAVTDHSNNSTWYVQRADGLDEMYGKSRSRRPLLKITQHKNRQQQARTGKGGTLRYEKNTCQSRHLGTTYEEYISYGLWLTVSARQTKRHPRETEHS